MRNIASTIGKYERYLLCPFTLVKPSATRPYKKGFTLFVVLNIKV